MKRLDLFPQYNQYSDDLMPLFQNNGGFSIRDMDYSDIKRKLKKLNLLAEFNLLFLSDLKKDLALGSIYFTLSKEFSLNRLECLEPYLSKDVLKIIKQTYKDTKNEYLIFRYDSLYLNSENAFEDELKILLKSRFPSTQG